MARISNSDTDQRRGSLRAAVRDRWLLCVWLATVAYVAILSAESIHLYRSFRTGFDLAIYSQAVWLVGTFRSPSITVDDTFLLAAHFQPGLVLLAPLEWVGLGVPGLLVSQTVGLALMAPVLFALARDAGAAPRLAAVPALLWLVCPWIAAVNLAEFHPTSFVPSLLGLSVLAARRDQTLWLLATAALAMSFKEDTALVYLVLGLVLIFEGKRRQGAILAVASSFTFVLALAVVSSQGDAVSYYGQRFAGDRGKTVPDALGWMLQHPFDALGDLLTWKNIVLVSALILATAGIALLAPVWILLGSPILAHNLLSAYPAQHGLVDQYQLLAAAAFFIAAALGVSRLASLGRLARLAAFAAVLLALVGDVGGGIFVHSVRLGRRAMDEAAAKQAISLIPPRAAVAASVHFAPHLSHRAELYTLPEPFLPIWPGTLSLPPSDMAARAGRVDFAIFAENDIVAYESPDLDLLPPLLRARGFVEVFAQEGIHVFERKRT